MAVRSLFGRMHCKDRWYIYVLLDVLKTTDPNRPGMHIKLIRYLLRIKAPRIIYVSCNPATCARDLDYLCHEVVCLCAI